MCCVCPLPLSLSPPLLLSLRVIVLTVHPPARNTDGASTKLFLLLDCPAASAGFLQGFFVNAAQRRARQHRLLRLVRALQTGACLRRSGVEVLSRGSSPRTSLTAFSILKSLSKTAYVRVLCFSRCFVDSASWLTKNKRSKSYAMSGTRKKSPRDPSTGEDAEGIQRQGPTCARARACVWILEVVGCSAVKETPRHRHTRAHSACM